MDEVWQGMLCCTSHAFYPRHFSWLPWLHINQAFVDTSQTLGDGYKSVPSLLYGDLEDGIGDNVLHLNSSPFPDFASICWAAAASWASLSPVPRPSDQRCSQQQLVRNKASGLSGFSNWAVMASLPRIGSGKDGKDNAGRSSSAPCPYPGSVSGTARTTSWGQRTWKSELHDHKSSSPGGAIHMTRP